MPRLSSLLIVGGRAGKTILPWDEARVITHGFTAGGYKNNSPWSNVNLTQHSTDTSSNLGNIMSESGAYLDAANSDNYMYVFAVGGMGSYSTTWSMNQNTQTSRGSSTSAWNLVSGNRDDLATMVDWEHRDGGGYIYIVGGGVSQLDRLTMSNETMSSNGMPATGGTGGVTSSFEGETRGYYVQNGTGSGYLSWATNSISSWTTSGSPDGWGKAVGSFKGRGYQKDGSFGGGTMRRYNDIDASSQNTFGVTACAEENMQQGGNKGYCLGQYDGNQNNNSYKISYSSDTSADIGANGAPKGQDGMSSAGCSSGFSINSTAYGTTAPAY